MNTSDEEGTRGMRARGIIKLFASSLAITAALAACGGGSSDTDSPARKGQAGSDGLSAAPRERIAKAGAAGGGEISDQPAFAGPAGSKAPGSSADFPGLPDRIVKNADLTLEIEKDRFDDTWSKVLQAATRFGGLVAGSERRTISDDPARVSGKLTIRVPARRFEEAMVALRGFGKVTGDTTTSDDVTQEFVDLESRLRNLRAQQAVLLKLFDQARNVGETLTVQGQLSNVQGEIERITGRVNVLKSQTDLSTINVSLQEAGTAVPAHKSRFEKAWNQAVDGLVEIGAVLFVGAIWLTPFALLIIMGLLLARKLYRRPQTTASADAGAAPSV